MAKVMFDVMVDIETLGTGKKGKPVTIIQLAAAFFNRYTGAINETFNITLDVTKSQDFHVEPETLLFWLKDSPKLLVEMLEDKSGFSEKFMLERFYYWLQETVKDYSTNNPLENEFEHIRLWGFGSNFDNALIRDAFHRYTDLEYPIHHNNNRDMHTLLDLTTDKCNIDRSELKKMAMLKGLTKHDALDDVRYQASLVAKCYELLDI